MWRLKTLFQFSKLSNLGLGFHSRYYYSSNQRGKRFAALWGNGDYGRLGLGNVNSQWKPVICSSFNADNLRSIACGGAHTLFLTEHGRVYASGLNDFGQLGISDDKDYAMEPYEVYGLDKEIKHVSAGYCHSCAITVDGDLYMWGKNSNGQLGLGKSAPKAVSTPRKVECLTGIIIEMTSLGSEHSIAVTDEGVALSWGGGSSGRLGHDRQSGLFSFVSSMSEYTPRLVKRLEGIKVKTVAAGLLHSACIDENGTVYVFGDGKRNKFSLKNSDYASGPSMVSELPFSEEVACGGYHTCVITRNGELYTWGSNENGCLGIGFLVDGSTRLQFQMVMFSHGVGEVLMEHSLWMVILPVDSWGMELMSTTLSQLSSILDVMLRQWKSLVDLITLVPYLSTFNFQKKLVSCRQITPKAFSIDQVYQAVSIV